MRHLLTFLILFVLTTTQTIAQDWVWGLKATGNHQYSGDTDIAVDHEGNVVVAGYYQLTLKLDTFSLYTKDDYYSDIYLCRMDSAHNVKWIKHIETGTTYDEGIGVTIDEDKYIYLTGSKDGKIFVSKYDSLGNEMWFCNFNNKFY